MGRLQQLMPRTNLNRVKCYTNKHYLCCFTAPTHRGTEKTIGDLGDRDRDRDRKSMFNLSNTETLSKLIN